MCRATADDEDCPNDIPCTPGALIVALYYQNGHRSRRNQTRGTSAGGRALGRTASRWEYFDDGISSGFLFFLLCTLRSEDDIDGQPRVEEEEQVRSTQVELGVR
jgi:hypothetical protein